MTFRPTSWSPPSSSSRRARCTSAGSVPVSSCRARQARARVGRGRAHVGDRAPARRDRLADGRGVTRSRGRGRAGRGGADLRGLAQSRPSPKRLKPLALHRLNALARTARRAARRGSSHRRPHAGRGNRGAHTGDAPRLRLGGAVSGTEATARPLGTRGGAHRSHARPQPRGPRRRRARDLVALLPRSPNRPTRHDLAAFGGTRRDARSIASSACAPTRTPASPSCSTV